MELSTKEQSIALIQKSTNILLVTSEKFSGDGIASILALQDILTNAGKKVTALLPHELPPSFSFLKGAEKIRTGVHSTGDFIISLSSEKCQVSNIRYQNGEKSVDIILSPDTGVIKPEDITFKNSLGNFDLIIAVDTLNLESVGSIFESQPQLFAETPIINIGAQAGNEFFGKINLVEHQKSSTTEIIASLIVEHKDLAPQLTPELATICLCGIISATGSFLESNTTPRSLELASQLFQAGAAQSDIIENLFKKKSLTTLKIWGKILSNLEQDRTHKVAWSQVSRSDLDQIDASTKEVDNITNELLRHLTHAEIVILMIEDKHQVLTQVRSAAPAIDFSDLKTRFGTGERVAHGLDIITPDQQLATVKEATLTHCLNYQKDRLGIAADLGLQVFEITPEESTSEKNAPTKNTATPNATPVAPTEIPFIVPESKTEIKTVAKEVPAEKPKPTDNDSSRSQSHDNKNSNIPDWLKNNEK